MKTDGEAAEATACRFLRHSGYEIVARNWRTRTGEVDVIARDGDVLVFVEVKARASEAFGGPEAAVDWRKQRRLIAAARAFVAATACELAMRFDVVSIRPNEIAIIQDAFQVPS